MATDTSSLRADAARNRERILRAARTAFADSDADVSMAELARLAEVGSGTLYRNFPHRRALLEALYLDEVDAICAAAALGSGTAGEQLAAWLERFFAYFVSKRHVADELLQHIDSDSPVFSSSRDRVLAAGRPLLEAAHASGEVQADLGLEQALDLVLAVARINADQAYVAPILCAAIRGLSPPAS